MAQTSSRSRIRWVVVAGLGLITLVGWMVMSSARGGADIPNSALPDDTAMGAVTLNVHDLETMRSYYEHAVGLTVLDETADQVILGYDQPVITLMAHDSSQQTATPSDPGLYHSAIVYPDEATLAQTLVRLASAAPASYQGAANHAVSIAFYFVDPEGNGLELYVDTPEDEWHWVDGQIQMGSDPVDINAFIQNHLAETDRHHETVMGHAHLKVGNLDEAEAFYADTLGFAVTARIDGAVFYSAGGYHHHLATNIWHSAQVEERTNPAGLRSFTVTVPTSAALDELEQRLTDADYPYERDDDALRVDDPWGNTVYVTTH